MKSVVCTLFEGNYHHGVAVLINSLFKNGFRGEVCVGYRGELPEWTCKADKNIDLKWENASRLIITDDLIVNFLPITFDYHMTNYKPDFIIELWNSIAYDADAIFYFDPDIIIKCNWSFFENWVDHGVALVHEISSNDMPINHPIRGMWKGIIEDNNEKVCNDVTSYINAGFVGLRKKNIQFVEKYSKFVHLSKNKYNVDVINLNFTSRTDPFSAKDQDALNIAAMCCSVPLSEMGPEAMDFIHGGFTMSHAIGRSKPWNKSFVLSALKGIPPSLPDKVFWQNVGEPIVTFEKRITKLKILSIKIASFIGRFYRKN
ncbi:hypothetical protein [Flavobacterium ovatum]|uniref:hypothetical protein n=1 Tax=Flavobacterium ovatum TaxID=1928857 RepID=UPI00344BEEBC